MTEVAVAQRVESLAPPSHDRWMAIAQAENAAFMRLLRSLNHDEWSNPTECSRWNVKDIAAHVLGAAEGFTSLPELRRQLSAARKRKEELGNQLNAMNEAQVEDRRGLSPHELMARLEQNLDRFMKLRRRVGGVGKVIPLYDGSLLGLTTARYLLDTIFSRDVFMHRIDISRAVDRLLETIPEDRELVADVVRDWARRSKADVRVELTGAAGGSFTAGGGSSRLVADAVEFCRVISGRGSADALEIEGHRDEVQRALAVGCPF